MGACRGVDSRSPDNYLTVMAEELGRRPGNLRFGQRWTFAGVDLGGRSALDIGAGEGYTSFYLACSGAARVVSLEPEAAGSRGGAKRKFMHIRERLGANQVEFRPETLQEFDACGERFDMLISIASINHLDEAACMRLHHDGEARERYAQLFSKLADLAKPGADLIVCDASRHNFFGRLGRRSPLVPKLDWDKHQAPQLWAQLLEQAGFREPRIRWSAFNTLRWPGRVLLGNRVAAYFLTSGFCLTMKRDESADAPLGRDDAAPGAEVSPG